MLSCYWFRPTPNGPNKVPMKINENLKMVFFDQPLEWFLDIKIRHFFPWFSCFSGFGFVFSSITQSCNYIERVSKHFQMVFIIPERQVTSRGWETCDLGHLEISDDITSSYNKLTFACLIAFVPSLIKLIILVCWVQQSPSKTE